MLPAEAFPNALLKQWETEIFVLHFFIFAFFSKTGKRKFTLSHFITKLRKTKIFIVVIYCKTAEKHKFVLCCAFVKSI